MANENSSSSNSNMLLLIPRFNGEKYDYWSKNVKVLLKSLEIWNIVEEGYVEPENEGALSQQQRNALRKNRKKDSKALFYIYQTIQESVYERIAQAETSKEAWEIIHAAYKGKEKVKMVCLLRVRKAGVEGDRKHQGVFHNRLARICASIESNAFMLTVPQPPS